MKPDQIKMTTQQAQFLAHQRARMLNALSMFRPAAHQEEFFRTFARDPILEVMLGGGNRSGKSLSSAAVMASFILNQPITFHDGTRLHMRPERWRHEAVKVWILGYDWDHCGSTIYRLLFMPDAFRIIRDKTTRKWRSWNPLDPEEKIEMTKAAPPFLPLEEVRGGEKGMAWENKRENQISSAVFGHDNTRVEFYPSTAGTPPMGDPVHLIWIDEHIANEAWYSELMVRLIDYRGRLFWSAWADTAPNSSIMEAQERAQQQAAQDPDEQTSFSFTFQGRDNPFTKSKHRERIMETMDEETRAARDEGIPNSDRWKIYAKFNKYLHRAMMATPEEDDELSRALRQGFGQIPTDWTRYMILDPGTTHAAVLFVAVPPPKIGDYIVPYDEIYVPKTSAEPLAKAAAMRTKDFVIEDIIADPRASRQTPMGFSKTIGQNYEEEFTKAGVKCRRHGSKLSYGSDDVDSRILRLQRSLNIRGDGTVRLRVLGCPDLVRQMSRARWGSDPKGNPIQKPSKYQRIDLVQCFDDQTEVLTENGWSRFENLDGTECLGTVNLKTDMIEYQQPSRIIRKDHNGDMLAFGGHKLDVMVTPNHRMVVNPNREPNVVEIREAQYLKAWDRIKLHAKWQGSVDDKILVPRIVPGKGLEKEMDPGDFAEFLGWYLAEGCCQKYKKGSGRGYAVHVSQSQPSTKPILRMLLAKLPWIFCETPHGFVCSSVQLWTYLLPYGTRSYNKFVPQWIKDGTPEVIRRFMIGAVFGDGWTRKLGGSERGRMYYTVSKRLADDMQELFMKSGTSASIMERPAAPWAMDGRSGMSRLGYVLSEWTLPRAGLRNHAFEPNYGPVHYEGKVYCASVPNTTLIVRRNGRPVITGNCLEYQLSRDDCGYFKPPDLVKDNPLGPDAVMKSLRSVFGRTVSRPGDNSVYCGAGPVPIR